MQCSPQPYNKQYDFEKFLSILMTFTKFPPMIYALRSLKEFSFLTISGWVNFIIININLIYHFIQTALIESFFLLFKAIIDTFATGLNNTDNCF